MYDNRTARSFTGSDSCAILNLLLVPVFRLGRVFVHPSQVVMKSHSSPRQQYSHVRENEDSGYTTVVSYRRLQSGVTAHAPFPKKNRAGAKHPRGQKDVAKKAGETGGQSRLKPLAKHGILKRPLVPVFRW